MFVQWSSETNSVIKGAQAVVGEGDGWLPFVEGENFVVNTKTQTSRYVLSEDGTFVTLSIEGSADLTWEQQRLEAYGGLADQLDMIWHDMNNGTFDSSGVFFTHVKDIKDANPKG